jgi:protein-L-isoaspartate(D-aspartate) O-methyltransferase
MAPFDAIIGTAAPVSVPPKLLAQLKPGGRMVIPVGRQNGGQELLRITRAGTGELPRVEHLLPVRFVPMTGEAEHVE